MCVSLTISIDQLCEAKPRGPEPRASKFSLMRCVQGLQTSFMGKPRSEAKVRQRIVQHGQTVSESSASESVWNFVSEDSFQAPAPKLYGNCILSLRVQVHKYDIYPNLVSLGTLHSGTADPWGLGVRVPYR